MVILDEKYMDVFVLTFQLFCGVWGFGLFFKLKVGKGTNYFGSPSLALPVPGISHAWSLLIPKFSRMRKLRFIEIIWPRSCHRTWF